MSKWECENELYQIHQGPFCGGVKNEPVVSSEKGKHNAIGYFLLSFASLVALLGLSGCSLEAGILSSVFEEKIQVQFQSMVAPQNNLSVIPITVVFSENVVDLSLADFTALNGAVSDLTKGTEPNTYHLNVLPSQDGLVKVVFSAKLVKLGEGEEYRRTVGGEISFLVNRTEASVSIAGPNKMYVNSGASVEFTLNFSGVTEIKPDLTSYLSLTKTDTADCTTMSLVSISEFEKKVVLSGCSGNGTVHLAVAPGSAVGVNGMSAGVESSYAVTVDTVAPKLTIANPTPLLGSKAHTFRWTVTLSDPSFDLSDLLNSLEWTGDVTGCVFSATGTGVSRVVQATSCSETTELSFSIPEGYIEDLAKNKSAQVSSALVKVDNTGPSAPTGVSLGAVPENLKSTPTFTFTAGVDTGGSTTSKNYIRILQGATVIRDWIVFTSGQALTSGLNLVQTTEYEVQIRSDDALGNSGSVVTATWVSMTPNCVKGTTEAGDICDGGARYLGSASDIVTVESIVSRFMVTPSGCGEIPADKIAGGSGVTAYSFGDFESTCSDVDVKKAWSNGNTYDNPDLLNGFYLEDRYGDENTNALSLKYKETEMGISAAARYCQNLVYGGYDDWYLPSITESKLFNNIKTASIVPLSVKFSTSSEYTAQDTYTFELTSSHYSRGYAGKFGGGNHSVRCIRRIGPMAPKNLNLQEAGTITETPKILYDNAVAEVGFPVQSYEARLIKKETRAIVKAWGPHTSGDAIAGLSLETGAYVISVRAIDSAGNRGKISSIEWIYKVDCSNLNATLAGAYCDSGVIYVGKLAPGAESGGASVDHYMVTPGGCEPTPDSVRVGAIGIWAYPNGPFTPQCDHVLDKNLVRWSNQDFDIPDIFGYENSEGTGVGHINKDLQYGSTNTNFIVSYATSLSYFPAAQYCANLNYGGFTDWFLPNRYELNLLYTNRAKINGLEKNKTGFEGKYLSSTEAPPRDEMVWMQDMSYGEQTRHWKNSRDTLFRCMRRESVP